MPDGTETLEEIQAKLKDLGIPLEGWGKTKGGAVQSPLIEKQKEALRRAKGFLEDQLKNDRDLLAELQEQANRLEHGGGS
jgi:hypothetical protein